DRTGAGVDTVVTKSEFTFVSKPGFAVERESKWRFPVFHSGEHLAHTSALLADAFRVAQQRALVHVEINFDRVDGQDRRQQRIAAAGIDQVARPHFSFADSPRD